MLCYIYEASLGTGALQPVQGPNGKTRIHTQSLRVSSAASSDLVTWSSFSCHMLTTDMGHLSSARWKLFTNALWRWLYTCRTWHCVRRDVPCFHPGV